MKVPTVTADDLAAFHARVYGRPAPPASLPHHPSLHNQSAKRKRGVADYPGSESGPSSSHNDHRHDDAESDDGEWGLENEEDADAGEYDEDDGLGYYPDGVKRTLTDEQVAMFRHSEIYAMQRQHQIADENRDISEKDAGEVVEGETRVDGDSVRSVVSYGKPSSITEFASPPEDGTSKSRDRSTNSSTNEGETSQYATSGGDHGARQTLLEQNSNTTTHLNRESQGNAPPTNQNSKRNQTKANPDGIDEINKERKSRAEIRELDAVFSNGQALDYGDGEADSQDADASTTAVAEVNQGDSYPLVGRKIWWPVLRGE